MRASPTATRGVDLSHRGSHLREQRLRFARGAQRVEQRPVSRIFGAEVDLWAAVLMDVVEPGLLDHADDRQRDVGAERNLRAERVAAGKEPPGESRVDERLADAGGRERSNVRPATIRMPITSK